MKIVYFIFLASLGFAHSKPKIESRIIGGEKARAGQFPFMAAINVTTFDGHHFCGGALVHRRWVLTAGHCASNAKEFVIRLGTNSLQSPDAIGNNGLEVATGTSVIHPQFNSTSLEHDMALIHLHMDVSYTQWLHPITLAPVTETVEGMVATISGWGQQSDATADVMQDLHYVTVAVISTEECKITYGDQIKKNMICTMGNSNEGLCIGDTGGPLVSIHSSGEELLMGVGSFFSQAGCETLHPSGYVRLDAYTDWIVNVTNSV